MCIRDRRRLCERVGEPVVVSDLLFEALQFALAVAAASDGAVSYTHLPAHETVLELVCRLLLETKQQDFITSYIQITLPPTHTSIMRPRALRMPS